MLFNRRAKIWYLYQQRRRRKSQPIPPPVPTSVLLSSGSFLLYGGELIAEGSGIKIMGSGDFALTGGELIVQGDQITVLDSGIFALTGGTLLTEEGESLILDTGTFALTGGDLTAQEDEGLPIETGTFALTGDALIIHPGMRVSLDTGAFALQGPPITYESGLAMDTGLFILEGGDVTVFSYGNPQVGQLAMYIMTRTPPSYRVGQMSMYIVHRTIPVVPVQSGSFSLEGGSLDATLLQKSMDTGSFSLEGGALGAAVVPEYIVGAWGLRRLVDSYVGPLIRVRDTDDDSEFDVGQDGSGNLLPVTTTGDAAVVRIYDQTQYGSDLTQATASAQPLLVQNITPKGGPAIKFDGVDDLIEDPVWATDRPYLVAQPSVWLGIGMSVPNVNWGIFYAIPHNRPTIGAPHSRMSLGFDLDSQFVTAARTNGIETRNLLIGGIRREHGWNYLAHTSQYGLVQNGIEQSRDEPVSVQATVTYPNATNFMLGKNNQAAPFWGGYFVEALVIDNEAADFSAAQIKEEIEARKLALLTVSHQLWRLRITDNFNNGTGDRSSRFSQLRFNATAGGTAITIPNQPAFASHRNSLAEGEHQLFNTTNTNVWNSGDVPGPHYVGVDFGQAQMPEELVLVSMQTTGAANQALMPRIFDVQYMDDNGDWVTVKSVDLTSDGVASAKTYTIDLT